MTGGDFSFSVKANNTDVDELGKTGITLGSLSSDDYKLARGSVIGAIKKALVGVQNEEDIKPGSAGSLQVLSHCSTDKTFLDALANYESGEMKRSLEEEFSQVGIKVDGLEVKIENMAEVNGTKKAIREKTLKRKNIAESSTDGGNALNASATFKTGGEFSIIINTIKVIVVDTLSTTAVALGALYAPDPTTAITLGAFYFTYKLVRPIVDAAIKKALGGDQNDQEDPEIKVGCLHVLLRCLTDNRFLEVLEDCESGKMRERLEKELSLVGIKVVGLTVKIKNLPEVNKTKGAINKRKVKNDDWKSDVKENQTPFRRQASFRQETMATLDSSNETTNGTKLMRLILDGGTEALRNVFRRIHPGDLQVVLYSHRPILLNLNRHKIINQKQLDTLCPTPPGKPHINKFDITLLCVLLRNICGLSPPLTGWDKMPNVSDHSNEADIVRIKLFRNERFDHIPRAAVSEADFKKFWAEISPPLVRLGIDQKEIDRLENEECWEEEVSRIRKEWKESDNKLMKVLHVMNAGMNVLVRYHTESRCDILKKNLNWCDFQGEIELYNAKFTQGTREWVFEQVSNWFNDETSENRVFVITGHAGMGKFIIAAVICKRFAEHVGASHFFQWNNSRNNNPKIFLQSLAWHLCKVLPEYKVALVEKLSENVGKSLNEKNLEGLFSLLLKEPLSRVENPGKHIMIVLDAVDESEYEGRQDFANLISIHLHKLPLYIRFVITTRPVSSILGRFIKLNPLYIEPDDQRNMADLKLVMLEKIPEISHDLLDSLAKTSDGLMLYAFFLTETYQCEYSMERIGRFPKGIEQHYLNYFQRLERELKVLEISEGKFLSFLSALAVAKESLPEVFATTVFGFENPADAKRKTTQAINILSSLLVIHEDKSLSFFHKSVRDWLVDNAKHNFSVDVQYGDRIIFDLCVKKLNDVKENGVSKESLAVSGIKYAIKYCIPHMLKGLEDKGEFESFVCDYFTDLEVVFASVYVDANLAVENLKCLMSPEISSHFSDNTKPIVGKLCFLIRKYVFFLKQYPQTFLQNVVNEGGEPLSSRATQLLETRYKDIFYFRLNKEDGPNNALELNCNLSGHIRGIDVSPKHEFVVCCYLMGGIELFSLETGMSEWKIQDYTVEVTPFPISVDLCTLPHCIVFHPRGDLILPGKLDAVLTLAGTFTKGPFQCDQGSSAFTDSCFSPNGSKMATYYRGHLIVWDISSGIKQRCLSCNTLSSLSFTASGNFLGTTDSENLVSVYDVSNNYELHWKQVSCQFRVEIVSTFEENSWLCRIDNSLRRISHDLILSGDLGSLYSIALPGNLDSSDELQRFLQNPGQSLLSKIPKISPLPSGLSYHESITKYILLGNKSVLVFSCETNVLRVFSVPGLMHAKEVTPNDNYSTSLAISTDGDFIYVNNTTTNMLTVCTLQGKCSSPLPPKEIRLVVVKGGVILYGPHHHPPSPEFWDNGITQRLSCFDELAGTTKCLSVSDEVIACQFDEERVVFFNVMTKQILHEMSFRKQRNFYVFACSINYHVLTYGISGGICLWKDGNTIDAWANLFSQAIALGSSAIQSAEFSPEVNTLAISVFGFHEIFIFDVVSISMLARVSVYGDCTGLKYFDEANLICGSGNQMIYFVNARRGEILTCLDVGDLPTPISVCQKQNIVCVGLNQSETFEIVKVILPRM